MEHPKTPTPAKRFDGHPWHSCQCHISSYRESPGEVYFILSYVSHLISGGYIPIDDVLVPFDTGLLEVWQKSHYNCLHYSFSLGEFCVYIRLKLNWLLINYYYLTKLRSTIEFNTISDVIFWRHLGGSKHSKIFAWQIYFMRNICCLILSVSSNEQVRYSGSESFQL